MLTDDLSPHLAEPVPEKRRRPRRVILSFFSVVLMFVLLFLIFFYLNFQTVVVSGHSMEPTFRNNQKILICKALWLVGPVRKGDVVVVRGEGPGDYLVKRVAYLEGERVDYRNQPYEWDFTDGPYRVAKDSVYVLGDNEDLSEDSRVFGSVPLSSVIGKVVEY